jgi:hypothetical protein
MAIAKRSKSEFVKQKMPGFGSYNDLCYKTFANEVGSYPVIFILSFACVGSLGFCSYLLFGHKDVRITPSKRSSIVRYWGEK